MMLDNELLQVSEWISEHRCVAGCAPESSAGTNSSDILHFKKRCSEARQAWASAVCNSSSDGPLRNYFSFHLTTLSELTGQAPAGLYGGNIHFELTALIDHLYIYYQRFLDQNSILARSFVCYKIGGMSHQLQVVAKVSETRLTSSSLKAVLNDMLTEIIALPTKNSCTVGSLSYAELFLKEVCDLINCRSLTDLNVLIPDKLISINFNHIRFCLYLEEELQAATSNLAIPEKLAALRHRKFFFDNLNPQMSYASNWNSIGDMMCSWITEEMQLLSNKVQLEPTNATVRVNKLGFSLSVAQLACLTKVFYKAGIYLSANIGEVFSFSSLNFYSKKQDKISQGSFSKEYYSVSQKTAAQILDLLQKMTAIIKQDYFP